MFKRLLNDIFLWLITALVCWIWRLAAAKEQIVVYLILAACLMGAWVILGLIFQKYRRSYKEAWFWQDILFIGVTGGVLMMLIRWILPMLQFELSLTIAYWLVGIVMILDALQSLAEHYWKFALNMTVPKMVIAPRTNAVVTTPDEPRSPESIESIHQSILSVTTEENYRMLLDKAHLDNRQTKVIADKALFSITQLMDYQYFTLVDLTLLNNIRGINKRFCMANQKLPDDGRYICCYRPQEYVKTKILKSYPWGINYIVYTMWFFSRRVLPRLMMVSRLYYDVTKGSKRMFSKTEILGRLYYCGFEVDEVIPMGHIEYVIARRHSQPYEQDPNKIYGPIIKLPRVCEHEQIKYFYKFRTMHPYSEYIQQYVFDQRGGMNIADKSDDDWRITHWGKLLRKYWLDELPMLFNWIKADVKLVGVRPLSRTMFDQYPKNLQVKRTQCKPGLIPPFYVDHPKTFDELYASENKYLDEYFAHPFWTDTKYFFLTLKSILFKRMHSA